MNSEPSPLPEADMMLPANRRQHIMTRLYRQGSVKIRALSRLFSVSEMTIHRDLERLEAEGLLTKVRGGAVPVQEASVSAPETSAAVRCVMCYKKLRARTQVILHRQDGSQQGACCPHCGLMCLAQAESGITAVMVTEYLYGRVLNAQSASYLVAPDIPLCCTPTVLAFDSVENARRFQCGFGGVIHDLAGAVAHVRQAMQMDVKPQS